MKRKTFTLATVLLAILATSCSGGLDYMIEEYNSRFGIHDDSVLYPGHVDYDQRDMILDEYHVNVNHTLNIPAPRVENANYKWQMYKVEDNSEITILSKEENGVEGANFHLLERNLSVGTYKLKLTLTVGDIIYTDEALVTVYQENEKIPQTTTN